MQYCRKLYPSQGKVSNQYLCPHCLILTVITWKKFNPKNSIVIGGKKASQICHKKAIITLGKNPEFTVGLEKGGLFYIGSVPYRRR